MKKLIFLLSLVCISFAVNAQSTTPRFGTSANGNNTGSALNYAFIRTADAAGTDTVKFNPNSWETVIRPGTLVDSLQYQIKSVAGCAAGDKIVCTFLAPSGGTAVAKFIGSYWKVGSGTNRISMSANTRATIVFVFDGAYFCEVSRTTGM